MLGSRSNATSSLNGAKFWARRLAVVALAVLALFLGMTAAGSSASADEPPPESKEEAGQEESGAGHGSSPGAGAEDAAPPIPEKRELTYPNLGSQLNGQVVRVEERAASTRDAEGGAGEQGDGSVAVTVYLSGNVSNVVTFLEDNGGDPRNVGEDYIEAYVPVTLLGPLSEQAGVTRVREIVAPSPDQSPVRVAGHGPPVHGSVAWNQAGYSGQGGKVGIIDIGFRGFSSLMGGDLPATVAARCYTDVGVYTSNLADCEAVDDATDGVPFPECEEAVQRREVLSANHGTIVAESVIDIAPEVSLYIARPRSKADVQDAVAWMASEGVTVINQSLSWVLDGPGDGTSPRSNSPLRTVDAAVARNITWVNSAGNGARNTWFGAYADPDLNRAISFGGLNDEVLGIPVRDCRRYTVQLRWEDTWGGASTDLDLYLYDKRSARLILSISSEDEQSGQSGHEPFERLSFWSRVDSDDLGLVVYHHGGDAPEWIQLTVWGAGSIERYTKSGSIANPSESANPGLLAVGAAHWNDVRAIEPYSSRGPTPDGRVKPDVVGADCGATALEPLDEYNQGFCGTSQAAPHVAGLAALVRQRFPGYTPAQVAGYLKGHAEQREAPDPNNTWGHGFVKLPPPDGSTPPDPASYRAFTRSPADDFDTLEASGNAAPVGIWSDGTTMWVADWEDDKLYAYDMATRARVPGREFNTLTAAGNTEPQGIWSDGTTMWVADWEDDKLYAYDMATRARVPGKEFNTLEAAGNGWPQGIWSDGETVWVSDWEDDKLYAYDMATRARVPGRDFDTLKAARNAYPRGIWSDGTTMWVADSYTEKIYAYDVAIKARVSGREFNTLDTAANWEPRGVWSDGTTMWVADLSDGKLYAYDMQRESEADREALVALYNAAGGTGWKNSANWLTDAHIGRWHGVATDSSGRVTHLDLSDNQLTGAIPPELGSLVNLEELDLSENQLTGKIPTELGDLASLDVLYLSQNSLTGCIPTRLQRVPTNDLGQLGLPFCIPPEFSTAETGERAVAENTGPGMPIGDPVAATDPDSTTLTYELGGTDAVDFAIDSATGQLRTKSPLDYEAKPTYTVTVTARDGDAGHDDVTVTINVTNVDEDGDVTLSSTTTAAVGTAITASLTDPDDSVSGEAWQWQSSATTTGTYSDISGAASASYTPTNDDAGMYIRAMVSYTDGHGAGKSAMSQAVMVSADAPMTLLERYDADNDGCIQLSEARTAIGDYFGPPLGEALSLEDARKVIGLYFNCLSQSQ